MTYVPMTGRDREEGHRASTPLELFFDLCFVVAVAEAGRQLVHALAEDHVASGVTGYLFVFFGVWWAWMNFTWFASAYDVDDVPYRIATLVQISGVLIYSAGIPSAFNDNDWTVAVVGYLVMRLALTVQWLRAAAGERGAARRCALTYAIGLVICQAGWTAMLAAPEASRRWLFLVLVAAELLVPVVAERGHQTQWHPHHIAERYGLFTIIVLGETVAASTVAVQSAVYEHEALDELADRGGRAAAGLRGLVDLLRRPRPRPAAEQPRGHSVGVRTLRDLRVGRGHRRRHRGGDRAGGRQGPRLAVDRQPRGDRTGGALPRLRLAAALPPLQAGRGPAADPAAVGAGDPCLRLDRQARGAVGGSGRRGHGGSGRDLDPSGAFWCVRSEGGNRK